MTFPTYKQNKRSNHLMGLWIKNQNPELHRNQYYILFIDNTTRYATVHFLKWKDEAAQHVKNYLEKLKTHSKPPITIRNFSVVAALNWYFLS